MRSLRLAAVAGCLAVLGGCHRLPGSESAEVALFREAVGLDTAAHVSLAFCALAVVAGVAWVIHDLRRQPADLTQTIWGSVLALAGVLVGWGLLGDFHLLWRCS